MLWGLNLAERLPCFSGISPHHHCDHLWVLWEGGSKIELEPITEIDARQKDKQLCMAHDEKFHTDDISSYEISVDLYNYQAWKGPKSGHLGLAFNMLDTDNYDGVYVR